MKNLLALTFLLGISTTAFSQDERPTYRVDEISDDPTYGLTENNPIKVGFGPYGERYYLEQLVGQKGGKVKYERLGSCCFFETDSPKALGGGGLLDRYKVKAKGSKKVILYLNMYDFEEPKGIQGYQLR